MLLLGVLFWKEVHRENDCQKNTFLQPRISFFDSKKSAFASFLEINTSELMRSGHSRMFHPENLEFRDEVHSVLEIIHFRMLHKGVADSFP